MSKNRVIIVLVVNENRYSPTSGRSECPRCGWMTYIPNKHPVREVSQRKTENLGSNDVEQSWYLENKGSRPGNLASKHQDDTGKDGSQPASNSATARDYPFPLGSLLPKAALNHKH